MSVANIPLNFSPTIDLAQRILPAADHFQQADTDTRLVMLWMMAKRLQQASTTAVPAAIFSQVVQRLIRQLYQVRREDRLDALRDMVSGADTRLAEAYVTLDANMKLAFWYRLVNDSSQMEMGTHLTYLQGRGPMEAVLEDLDRRDFNELVGIFKGAVAVTGTATP